MPLSDSHRELIAQTRAANRRQRAKSKPVPNKIGDRDPATGQHRAIYPDGSETASGRKLYDAHANKGDSVTGLPVQDGTIGLLGAKGQLSPLAAPEQEGKPRGIETQGPLKTNEVGYLRGQVWNYDEPPKKPVGYLKYLYTTFNVAANELDIFIAGDRKEPLKIHSFPPEVDLSPFRPGFTITSDITALGQGKNDWLVSIAYKNAVNPGQSGVIIITPESKTIATVAEFGAGLTALIDYDFGVIARGNGFFEVSPRSYPSTVSPRAIAFYEQELKIAANADSFFVFPADEITVGGVFSDFNDGTDPSGLFLKISKSLDTAIFQYSNPLGQPVEFPQRFYYKTDGQVSFTPINGSLGQALSFSGANLIKNKLYYVSSVLISATATTKSEGELLTINTENGNLARKKFKYRIKPVINRGDPGFLGLSWSYHP